MMSLVGRAALQRAAGTATTAPIASALCQLKRAGLNSNQLDHSQWPRSTIFFVRNFANGARTARAAKPATRAAAAPKSKAPAKKPAAKKAAKPKKTATKAKAKAKPKGTRAKKPLTEAEKTKLAEKKAAEKKKETLKKLREKALLDTPKRLPVSAYHVYVTEKHQGADSSKTFAAKAKEISVNFKNLSTAEREHYNHVANENHKKNEVNFKRWLQQFTPDQIREANNARDYLKRVSPLKKFKSLQKLGDDRLPKRPTPARLHFFKDRWSTGDFSGIPLTEATVQINREWADLPESEKKAYEDKADADKQRYYAEFESVYHHESPAAAKATA